MTREVRTEIEREHKDTLHIVKELLASCQQPFAEVMRGAAALEGIEYIDLERLFSRTYRSFSLDSPEQTMWFLTAFGICFPL